MSWYKGRLKFFNHLAADGCQVHWLHNTTLLHLTHSCAFNIYVDYDKQHKDGKEPALFCLKHGCVCSAQQC